MNFFWRMERVNILDINGKCWDKVFVRNKFKNRVIDIR